MSNVPNQQKGQSLFPQTPLNADEEKLANQSEIVQQNSTLKPFCFSDNCTSTALIGQEVCQETSQPLMALISYTSHEMSV